MSDKRHDHDPIGMKTYGLNFWFYEVQGDEPDAMAGMLVRKVLAQRTSEFQELLVLDTSAYGRVLVLDGITQLAEFDESGYHEMIVHAPMLTHPDPKRVLIIGGGDGGSVTEVVRHPGVESVVLCEIDPAVVETAREFFPNLCRGLDDPRVEIVHEDGARYLADRPGGFDVVIVDSSDPIGPARALFQEPFYKTLYNGLAPGGLAVTQAESFFHHPQIIAGLFGFAQNIFPVTAYYYAAVPTYPSGLIGFAYCSKGPHPVRDIDEARAAALEGLHYYTPQMHRAAFALPPRILRHLPPEVRKFQEGF